MHRQTRYQHTISIKQHKPTSKQCRSITRVKLSQKHRHSSVQSFNKIHFSTDTNKSEQTAYDNSWTYRRSGDFGNSSYLVKQLPPKEYHSTSVDPPLNFTTHIAPEQIAQRTRAKYTAPPYPKPLNPQHFETNWDAIIIGAGHNGLICANYLANQDFKVIVLERRHVLGGGVCTEELYPGYKYNRGSSTCGLLRHTIIEELDLDNPKKNYSFQYIPRDPYVFVPTLSQSHYGGQSLILGSDKKATFDNISQFSLNDAQQYEEFLSHIQRCRELIDPLFDLPLTFDRTAPLSRQFSLCKEIFLQLRTQNNPTSPLYEFLTGSLSQIVCKWFDSDIMRATMVNLALPGNTMHPNAPGSAYLLLHSMLAQGPSDSSNHNTPFNTSKLSNSIKNRKNDISVIQNPYNNHCYIKGGMGSLIDALASRAVEHGVTIVTNTEVAKILTSDLDAGALPNNNEIVQGIPLKQMTDGMEMGLWGIGGRPNGKIKGVQLSTGESLFAPIVVSNASPYHSFIELLQPSLNELQPQTGITEHKHPHVPPAVFDNIRFANYQANVMKINFAVNKLPDFTCLPNKHTCEWDIESHTYLPGIQHRCSIFFEDKLEDIEHAYFNTLLKRPATRPQITMHIPSALDPSLVPLHPSAQVRLPPGHNLKKKYLNKENDNDDDDNDNNNYNALSSNVTAGHIVELTVQHVPYEIHNQFGQWSDEKFKDSYVNHILHIIEEYCPGFRESILHCDVLSPYDIEQTFGMHKGNIYHGQMIPQQLLTTRPAIGLSGHKTPIQGYYLCGSGVHPGGGITGSPGRNCSLVIMEDDEQDDGSNLI